MGSDISKLLLITMIFIRLGLKNQNASVFAETSCMYHSLPLFRIYVYTYYLNSEFILKRQTAIFLSICQTYFIDRYIFAFTNSSIHHEVSPPTQKVSTFVPKSIVPDSVSVIHGVVCLPEALFPIKLMYLCF